MGSSKECLQRKCFFFIRQNLSFFFLWPMKGGKSGDWWEERKDDRSDAMFRRIDPVPSFFSFSVKSFTSSWLRRCLMVFNFSNFCIVFFIFQRVQSLRDSREIHGLHVDGYLSNIKLELVMDNPILLRWDIKYVFRCRDHNIRNGDGHWILLKYPGSRFFYSQVEILCSLILRVKKFEDALLFLLSHRWHDL